MPLTRPRSFECPEEQADFGAQRWVQREARDGRGELMVREDV